MQSHPQNALEEQNSIKINSPKLPITPGREITTGVMTQHTIVDKQIPLFPGMIIDNAAIMEQIRHHRADSFAIPGFSISTSVAWKVVRERGHGSWYQRHGRPVAG